MTEGSMGLIMLVVKAMVSEQWLWVAQSTDGVFRSQEVQ